MISSKKTHSNKCWSVSLEKDRNTNRIGVDKLNYLVDRIAPRIEELLLALDIQFKYNYRSFTGTCPVHDGNNPQAWIMYMDGAAGKCRWKCFTRGCSDKSKYGSSIFGLVRGILSKNEGKDVGFRRAVNYICAFLGEDLASIKIDQSEVDKKMFVYQVDTLTKTKENTTDLGFPRHRIRQALDIGPQYYLDKGFKPEILDRYDVGTSRKKGKASRIIVPIYDESGQYMIGSTQRTQEQKCGKCDLYHNCKKCPETQLERYESSKWIFGGPKPNTMFLPSRCLYNFWYAKKSIDKTHTVYLTESPGNTWRMVQNGIKNVVGMFGNSLTEDQMLILECSCILNIILVPDNDTAGKDSAIRLKEQLSRYFNFRVANIDFGPYEDVGAMSDEYFCKHVKGKL